MKTTTLVIGIILTAIYATAASSESLKTSNTAAQIGDLETRASNGDPKLQLKLASMFMHGTGGVAVDRERAISWYTIAAEQDIGYAQHKLAYIYLEGKGVEQSYEQALYWLTRAAKLGFVEAQLDLSSLYERGDTVPQDLVSAYKWLVIADSLAELDVEARQDELEDKMSFIQWVKANYLSRQCILRKYQDC